MFMVGTSFFGLLLTAVLALNSPMGSENFLWRKPLAWALGPVRQPMFRGPWDGVLLPCYQTRNPEWKARRQLSTVKGSDPPLPW